MSRSCRNVLLLAAITLVLAVQHTPGAAQNASGINDAGRIDSNTGLVAPGQIPGEGTPQFILEPEVQIQGDTIKQQTYRTNPTGQNKNWNLDIGRFQPPITEDPSEVADDLQTKNYSGMRLRLPLRGGLGE